MTAEVVLNEVLYRKPLQKHLNINAFWGTHVKPQHLGVNPHATVLGAPNSVPRLMTPSS